MAGRRLYLAGPMSGRADWGRSAFAAAAALLAERGFEVINPHDLNTQSGIGYDENRRAEIMRRDLIALLSCDGVAVLDEWWTSRGARFEVSCAAEVGLVIRPVAGWYA